MSTVETKETNQRRMDLTAWNQLPKAPITATVGVICATVIFSNSLAEALQFDRTAVADGQWWRIATGHLVHWNLDHLFWDALMFLSLGAICERRNRQRFVVCLVAAAVSIPLILRTLMPEIQTYRGLSGLDTALFTMLAAWMFREKWRDGQWRWVALIASLFSGLVVKVAVEMLTGSTIFVDAAAANFQPVPLAHVVGGSVGAVTAIWPSKGGILPKRGAVRLGNLALADLNTRKGR